MAESSNTPTPRQLFTLMQRQWLGDTQTFTELLAEDAIIEMPFARPGRPSRIEGREKFHAFAQPQQAAFPVRFDAVTDIVIHDTADPEVIVAEYTLVGTLTTTGHSAEAPFIAVLRARDGQIVNWREYQNIAAIMDALSSATGDLATQPDPTPPRA